MNKEEWLKKGYVTEPVDKTLDLKAEIDKLRKEKNAVILGHYYQADEIQEIADFIGDSLALAQWAAKTDADIIVMCGVHFMGETAKILCPDKKVLIPDFNAGCSLADSCPADKFSQFVKEHPDHTVISYVNTSAAVKAVTDVVVTSTNAKQIVESFAKEQKIIFGPDKNLGNYINSITNRNMLLWDGACHVHEKFSVEKIIELKKQYPDADVLVHAVMDALLGAAALGDIGQHFPDTDPAYEGASSIELLKKVGELLQERGYVIENIDATIIAQRPKLAAYRPQMAENIADALGLPVSRVSVKATTEEGLGFTGSGEGISSQAITLLTEVENYCYDSEMMTQAAACGGCGGCGGCQAAPEADLK